MLEKCWENAWQASPSPSLEEGRSLAFELRTTLRSKIRRSVHDSISFYLLGATIEYILLAIRAQGDRDRQQPRGDGQRTIRHHLSSP
jgi:hypothetical protein